MKKRKGNWYCILCWQEFDDPSQHNAGSFHGKERLNGGCPGDIRRRPDHSKALNSKHESPLLDLDAGDPVRF
jgi:hypothetical protein